jgi:hypothetical protein
VREPAPDLHAGNGAAAGHEPGAAPLWRTAASQRVRDLAWCTLSPALLSRLPPNLADPALAPAIAHWPDGALRRWEDWLRHAAPQSLPPALEELAATPVPAGAARQSLRLGRHAERLLDFALRHTDGLQWLAANLPVRRAGGHGVQTLGELDFVWRDLSDGAVVHWEMAAKFYLLAGREPVHGLHSFVGPNLVDRLADKLDHLLRRQLPLGHAPEARLLLGETVARSEVYLLGWLFFRNGEVPGGLEALGISPAHLHGWWATLEDWRAQAAPGSRWCRLPRTAWLSGALMPEAVAQGAEEIEAVLTRRFTDPAQDSHWRRESPVMLCELEPGPGGMWRERSRGFVVPPGWEARALARAAEQPA